MAIEAHAALPIASPVRRIAGGVVDGVAVAVISALAIAADGFVPEGDIVDPGVLVARLAIAIGYLGAMFVYFALPEWKWGRTLGKALLGMRVVSVDGTRASGRAVVVRTFLRAVDYQFAGLLGALLVLVTPLRQRLGDMAAGTVVVRIR